MKIRSGTFDNLKADHASAPPLELSQSVDPRDSMAGYNTLASTISVMCSSNVIMSGWENELVLSKKVIEETGVLKCFNEAIIGKSIRIGAASGFVF